MNGRSAARKTCRSYGAWLQSSARVAINMALLTELSSGGRARGAAGRASNKFVVKFGSLRFRLPGGGRLLLFGGAGEVEGEEVFEDLVVGEFGGPGVGGGDGGVEFLVGEVEAGGALVVEVGQGAFLKFGRRNWAL